MIILEECLISSRTLLLDVLTLVAAKEEIKIRQPCHPCLPFSLNLNDVDKSNDSKRRGRDKESMKTMSSFSTVQNKYE